MTAHRVAAGLLLRGFAFQDFVGNEYVLVQRSDVASSSAQNATGTWEQVDASLAILRALREALEPSSASAHSDLVGIAHPLKILEELGKPPSMCRFVVFRQERTRFSFKPHEPDSLDYEELAKTSEEPVEEVTDFVGLELVDAEGVAVVEAKVLVEYPNGTVVRHSTDAQGKIYIDGIDPGQCKVQFLDVEVR